MTQPSGAIQNGDKQLPGNFIVRFFASHPIGFWFFFWGEFAERCSYYGMRAILTIYMADQLGLGQDNAATYMSFFIAGCYFLPLVGGWVADNYLGKFWTIAGFSIPYILGHVILGFENYYCLVIALLLLAMGSGVIKPNISTLMGLTYDQQRPGQTKLRSDGFAIFYFSINIGAALSQFAMPSIRTQFGYAVAFLFPAALMVISFMVFVAGKRFYATEVISRKKKSPEQKAEQWRILGRLFGLFFLVMFFWAVFDQAASTWIFFTEACMNRHIFGFEMDADQMQAVNPVLILLLLPPITILWRYLSNRGVEVRATDKMVAGFVLTAGCMGVMALAAWLAGAAELRPAIAQTPEAEKVRLVVSGKETLTFEGTMKINAASQSVITAEYKLDQGDGKDAASVHLTFTGEGVLKFVSGSDDGSKKTLRLEGNIRKLVKKTTIGEAKPKEETLLEGDLKASVSGKMNVDERWFVAPGDQVTIWWLVFAYVIITVAEILISVTGLELAYTAAPQHMTGFITACWLLTVALANLLINAPVTRLYTKMQPGSYFGMLTVAMIVVTVAFFVVARRFNRGDNQDTITSESAK